MHACGHDAHVAILMAAAEIFAKLRADLPGTVKLIFQPAEEGVPAGEEGGARLMIKQGALDNPRPEAIFGLHVGSFGRTGTIGYRAGQRNAGQVKQDMQTGRERAEVEAQRASDGTAGAVRP